MNEPTRFDLDERQRAMLAEMGVRVWRPASGACGVPDVHEIAPEKIAEKDHSTRTSGEKWPETVTPAPLPPRPASTAANGASAPQGLEALDWPALEATVAACQACGLCATRSQTVFGVGDPTASWMVVGEAPGEQEDLRGEPFVGPAGQLLDNMLRAVGLARTGTGEQGVYIANVLKCRPPSNRNPQPDEVARCEPYLRRQVALVRPRIILAMGRFAVQSLLQTQEPIGRLRGRVHHYQGVSVVVTYHPAYLLRNLPDKAKAWADLVLALRVARGEAGPSA